mgnify:CR=1 FL=1
MTGEMTVDGIVLVSGGVDSAVTLAEAAEATERGDDDAETDGGGAGLAALHCRYGQHTEDREARCAERLASHYGAELVTVDLHDAFAALSGGLTDDSVDLSRHYDDEGVATSYVPMRNTVMLAVAAGVAERRGASTLWYGPNREDRDGYADCRDEYAAAMAEALSLGTDRVDRFAVRRPVVELEKPAIVERGDALGVPFEHTWSCYRDGDAPCGDCASCVERREGFAAAGVADPIAPGADAID